MCKLYIQKKNYTNFLCLIIIMSINEIAAIIKTQIQKKVIEFLKTLKLK